MFYLNLLQSVSKSLLYSCIKLKLRARVCFLNFEFSCGAVFTYWSSFVFARRFFQCYETKMEDLEHQGELGNGTCGHVAKMYHRCSGRTIAVKVRKSMP
jgi:hypothetical protein